MYMGLLSNVGECVLYRVSNLAHRAEDKRIRKGREMARGSVEGQDHLGKKGIMEKTMETTGIIRAVLG